ncbi:cyanophycin synthetase, partial [Marinobacter sp.]
PGRYEVLQQQPTVVVDVGHNPHAANWLAARIGRREPGAGRVIAVYAALADKDVEGVAGAMAPVVDEWHLAGLDVHRGLSSIELADRIGGLLRQPAATTAVSVAAAVENALDGARPEDLVVIFGSFYTVAQARVTLVETAP